jgi:hypothetical protein
MQRLHHSYAGYLRSMQMSSTDLFVFVEGKQADSYFYGRILASIPGLRVHHEIRHARELPGTTGGKKALLSFFDYVRKRRELFSSFKGLNTTCIFCLDKDVDDIRRTKKRSLHVVYTEHYDVQNYIFLHGDLLTGAASAASVDPEILRSELSDSRGWCLRVAMQWREWISWCLCMLERKISGEANYRVVSSVQTRWCGPTDVVKYAALISKVATNRGIDEPVLKRSLEATARRVDRFVAAGQHHRIFKGKWFATALADEIDRIRGERPYDDNKLAGRLTSSVAATLDFQESWADYFRDSIRNVADML